MLEFTGGLEDVLNENYMLLEGFLEWFIYPNIGFLFMNENVLCLLFLLPKY